MLNSMGDESKTTRFSGGLLFYYIGGNRRKHYYTSSYINARKNGNTARLANAFIKGIKENRYTTEKVYVNYQNIKPCLGCNVCQKKQCVQKDDRSKHNYLCFTCVFLHI